MAAREYRRLTQELEPKVRLRSALPSLCPAGALTLLHGARMTRTMCRWKVGRPLLADHCAVLIAVLYVAHSSGGETTVLPRAQPAGDRCGSFFLWLLCESVCFPQSFGGTCQDLVIRLSLFLLHGAMSSQLARAERHTGCLAVLGRRTVVVLRASIEKTNARRRKKRQSKRRFRASCSLRKYQGRFSCRGVKETGQ